MGKNSVFVKLPENPLRQRIDEIWCATSGNLGLRMSGDLEIAELDSGISIAEHRADLNGSQINCLDYVFRRRFGLNELIIGQNSIWPTPVKFLREQGFGQVSKPQEGDVALYVTLPFGSAIYDARHWGIVENGGITSKWNVRSVFHHPIELILTGWGTHVGYFRRNGSS